jgi:hypothetical protein
MDGGFDSKETETDESTHEWRPLDGNIYLFT